MNKINFENNKKIDWI